MESLLSNKLVLYGGVALVAIIAGYALFGSSSAAASEDGESGDSGAGLPMVLGGYGPPGAGTMGSTGLAADSSVELLANLEKAKAEFSYNVSMADIAATLQLGMASLATQQNIAFDTNQTDRILAGLDFSKAVLSQKNVQALVGTLDVGEIGSGAVTFNFAKIFQNDTKGRWTINNNTALLGGPGLINNLQPNGLQVPNASGIVYGAPNAPISSVPINAASSPVGTVNGYAGTAQTPYVPSVGQSANQSYAGQPSASSPASSLSTTASGTPVNSPIRNRTVSSKVNNTSGASAYV